MQILEENNNNNFELKIESIEDLWVLSEFITPNDRVFATTTRKVKLGSDKTKQVTKIIFVDLLVKKTQFSSEILRVSGEIQNETEFTAIGQAQTLNFNVNDKIKIKKIQIMDFEKKLLQRAVKSKNSKNLIILLDKDELIAIEFNNFNYTVIFHKSGLGNKKYHQTSINEGEEKYNLIKNLLIRSYSNIILAGPGIYKNKLQEYLKSKTDQKILVHQFTDVNTNNIQKLIKDISKSGIIEENQLSKENQLIEILLKNISSGLKFAYGYDKVKEAIDVGSVVNLLITTKYIDKLKEEDKYSSLNELMRSVEQLNGDIVIFDSKHQAGRILDGLGSIAAILRY